MRPAQAWARRCAACHDHAVGNIPPRALLATYPRARIVAALTTGFMRTQAAGLDPAQVAALADFVRAPPPAPPPTR
jgi:cytochrome c553